MLQSCPEARLLVIGEGPDGAVLRDLAITLEVAEQVLFAGYQVDTQPFYAVMDVFALASASEAFGLVLVEAMYAKLPVVATRVGGIPYVVKEGETGLLVAPGKPEALADAFLLLRQDTELRREMGSCGKSRAINEFSAERYIRDVDDLYQGLAAKYLD